MPRTEPLPAASESTGTGASSGPASAGDARIVDTDADVVASETWVRPPSCQPGQRWICPCGDIRPYVVAYCLGCYEDDDYHLAAAVALHAYADVAAGTPIGAPHSAWGATDPDALAVGEADPIAWGLVTDALDNADKAALDNAIERVIVDSAIRVLGVVGMRSEVEMILRGLADSHRLTRDVCHYDHHLGIGEPCPRSAT